MMLLDCSKKFTQGSGRLHHNTSPRLGSFFLVVVVLRNLLFILMRVKTDGVGRGYSLLYEETPAAFYRWRLSFGKLAFMCFLFGDQGYDIVTMK